MIGHIDLFYIISFFLASVLFTVIGARVRYNCNFILERKIENAFFVSFFLLIFLFEAAGVFSVLRHVLWFSIFQIPGLLICIVLKKMNALTKNSVGYVTVLGGVCSQVYLWIAVVVH